MTFPTGSPYRWRIREGGHLHPHPTPDEGATRDGTGPEPVAHPVEGAVEDLASLLLGKERELELLGSVGADEAGDRDADQRAPALLDQRPVGRQQPSAGLEPGGCRGRRTRQGG